LTSVSRRIGIADELSRPVVGQLAAALGVEDLDAAGAVEVLAERAARRAAERRPRV
jgi:hypothetical protein